ncbi:hypothetical protein NT6N_25270 [Oceaniferula spumae]|uniref:Zinc-regulated TonB-dependent outer membrane receptor n=1 Tax=Oceaniferula spumae TaxID=2979115 RepID=A0AAT9FNJ6_9BACT
MNNKYMKTAALVAACASPLCAEENVAPESTSSIRLEPTLHLRAVHGTTTLSGEDAAFGGHDPFQDGFNLQGIEIGANLYAGEYLRGFATVNVFKHNGEDFDAEFEEGFLKLVNLPGNLELRAGRMLARFGDQNSRHLHAWDFVDANMTNVRYLGDDGFAFEGAEISWMPPTSWTDVLSVGFGSAVAHDHDHGHGEHEEDHDDDDHDDHEDEHGHDEEAEMARPERDIVTVRYQAQFGPDDFNRFQVGGSFLTGENGFGMTTDIYGADFTYTWRENGLESGGRQFRWRTEWIMRDVENDEGGFEDNGFNTSVMWEFVEGWEAGLRYGWVEGVDDPELAERHRISPSIGKYFDFGNDMKGHVRLQYNHDEIDGHGSEDSVWLQFGFDWGPGEIR